MARITIYGEYLDNHPPEMEAEIAEQTAWSCAHGVERWRGNCGCHLGTKPGWTQAWRKPLREGLDRLRERVDPLFQEHAGELLSDPWQAREEYVEILWDRDPERMEAFLSGQCSCRLSREDQVRLLKLLEIQKNAMLAYTSCGWFFDEISGIESTQVMKYAARMIQLAEEVFQVSLEEEFLQHLELAPSNISEYGNGRRVYEKLVQPASVDFLFVGSHYALSSLFEEDLQNIRIYCYTAENSSYEQHQAGQMKLGLGKTRLVSNITWDETEVTFAAVYLGEHNANCGIREYMSPEDFEAMRGEIGEVFEKGDIPELIRCMDRHFGSHNYSLWHLFKDEQRKVLQEIIRSSLEDTEGSLRNIVDQNYALINFLTEIGTPMPRALQSAAETVIQSDLERLLEDDDPDPESLGDLIRRARNWRIGLNTTQLGYKASWRIDNLMSGLEEDPEDRDLLQRITDILDTLSPLSLDLILWQSQNIFFRLVRDHYFGMRDRADQGEEEAAQWLERLRELAERLQVMLPVEEEEDEQ